jgi:hypothetical protein
MLCCTMCSPQVYAPSTIAVFGPTSPKTNTPDDTTCVPTTMWVAALGGSL